MPEIRKAMGKRKRVPLKIENIRIEEDEIEIIDEF